MEEQILSLFNQLVKDKEALMLLNEFVTVFNQAMAKGERLRLEQKVIEKLCEFVVLANVGIFFGFNFDQIESEIWECDPSRWARNENWRLLGALVASATPTVDLKAPPPSRPPCSMSRPKNKLQNARTSIDNQLEERRRLNTIRFEQARGLGLRAPPRPGPASNPASNPAARPASTQPLTPPKLATGPEKANPPKGNRINNQRVINLQNCKLSLAERRFQAQQSDLNQILQGDLILSQLHRKNQSQAKNVGDLIRQNNDYIFLGKLALDYTNLYRKYCGLNGFIWDDHLAVLGESHCTAMARGERPVGHDGIKDRFNKIKISFKSAAENVAYNENIPNSAKEAVKGWIRSPGHEKNLVGEFEFCGISVRQSNSGGYYFTQLFVRSI